MFNSHWEGAKRKASPGECFVFWKSPPVVVLVWRSASPARIVYTDANLMELLPLPPCCYLTTNFDPRNRPVLNGLCPHILSFILNIQPTLKSFRPITLTWLWRGPWWWLTGWNILRTMWSVTIKTVCFLNITGLTSCWNEISIRDEEFVAVVFFKDIRQDLQSEALLLSGLLTPLVGVHFGVGQVCVIVFVFCKQRETKCGRGASLLLIALEMCTFRVDWEFWHHVHVCLNRS